MGAMAPSPAVDASLERVVGDRIVAPVLKAMAGRGTPYHGILYAGLMITDRGPVVVEFNCRFGDPETQAVLPLVTGSLARLLADAAAGRLDAGTIARGPGAVVSVAVVAEGYPAAAGGGTLEGLEALDRRDDLVVFHAGTARHDGAWRIVGGRALHVVASGSSRAEARARAYEGVRLLGGHGWRCRSDIAAGPDAGAPAAQAQADARVGGRS
jgi:phosphoribosylamine--glycine ligase